MTIHKTAGQRIAELENRVAKLEAILISPSVERVNAVKIKSASAKEFIMTKKLKTETQKVAALGYYLEYVGGMESFNIDDLETAFQSAKEKRPKNMNDAVNKNIARGLLMDAAEKKNAKKAWVLTSTGEKYVEEELIK